MSEIGLVCKFAVLTTSADAGFSADDGISDVAAIFTTFGTRVSLSAKFSSKILYEVKINPIVPSRMPEYFINELIFKTLQSIK